MFSRPHSFNQDLLSLAAPGDAIIAVDVGNNTYSFGRYFEGFRATKAEKLESTFAEALAHSAHR